MTDRIALTLSATIERRSPVQPRRTCYDATIGDMTYTGTTMPETAKGLARQLEAMSLCPRPIYRQHLDGRGAVAYISGCDDAGVLQGTVDLHRPDGIGAGGYMFGLTGITLDSEPYAVEAALKRALEDYLRGIGGM